MPNDRLIFDVKYGISFKNDILSRMISRLQNDIHRFLFNSELAELRLRILNRLLHFQPATVLTNRQKKSKKKEKFKQQMMVNDIDEFRNKFTKALAGKLKFKKGSGYLTGSGLLVLHPIQPIRLFCQAYHRFSAILS